jgi:spore germination cell wall hydrolase CwlJ-like protein
MADAFQPTMLQQMAAQFQTPQSVPAIQRSQYLAQALANMQDTAKEGIKSPTQLWSSLLANGLLQYAKSKNDQQLAGIVQSAQGAQNAMGDNLMGLSGSDATPAPQAMAPPTSALGRVGGMLSHLLGGGAPHTAPGAPQASQAPDPALQAIINAPPMQAQTPQVPAAPPPMGMPVPSGATAPMQGQASLPPMSPQDVHAAVQMAGGEARGEGPVGQQAVVAVAMNRAKALGLPLSAVIGAPHQFQGYDWGKQNLSNPNDPHYQAILQNITPALFHGQDPTNGADHYFAPQGMPGGAPPPWAVGKPQMQIGNHNFLALGPSSAGMPQPPPAPSPAPQAGAGMTPPPPPPPPAQAAAAPAPQQAQGVPTGVGPTPQEVALYHQLMANPLTRSEGLAMAQKIAQRQASPIELNRDEYFTPDGQAHSVHQLQDVQSAAPNSYTQRDPVTGELKITANPAYGPVGGSQVMGANGQISQLPGSASTPLITPQQRAAHGISPADRSAYNLTPGGKIEEGPKDPFGPSAQLEYTKSATADERYKNYIGARQNLTAMQQLMTQKGGPSDLALLENGGKTINPTIAIRPNMLEAMYGSQGIADNFMGELRGVVNHGGRLSPEARQAFYNAAQANVQSHWDALGPLLGKVDYDAKRFGVSRQDLLPDLQPMPSAGAPAYGGRAPNPNAGKYGPDPIAQAREAIARGAPRDAVIKQMRADGLATAGL